MQAMMFKLQRRLECRTCSAPVKQPGLCSDCAPRFVTAEELAYPFCRTSAWWNASNERGLPKPRELIDSPVIDVIYRAYLEQRRLLQPRDSQPISKYEVSCIYTECSSHPVSRILGAIHSEEQSHYTPPKYRSLVLNAE